MRKRQFSLASLLITVAGAAVLFAMPRSPSVVFAVLLVGLSGATVLARFGSQTSRRFCMGFALFGWLYVVTGAPLLDSLERSSAWATVHQWLPAHSPSFLSAWAPQHYLLFGHSVIALSVALLGGCVFRATEQASNTFRETASSA